MPNMFGGSSSDRDYAPHMYVYTGGNPDDNNSYAFVGNATVYYEEPDTEVEYHLGIGTMGEVVCDRLDAQTRELQVVSLPEIPDQAKRQGIEYGCQQIGSMEGRALLTGLGVTLPPDLPESGGFQDLINPADEARLQRLRDDLTRARQIGERLRIELLGE